MNKKRTQKLHNKVKLLKMKYSSSLTQAIPKVALVSVDTGKPISPILPTFFPYSTNSKSALAKDLVEGIEKDLEKLKRQQENLQLRKQLALTGQSVVEETAEEKELEVQQKLRHELEYAGTHVIAASPRKLQVMRHQGSQLGSIKNLDLDELEQMRAENERRLQEL